MYRLGQSVLDLLLDQLDHIDQLHPHCRSKDYVNNRAAASLYKIWKNQNNKISSRIYKRPSTISLDDVENMQQEGLIRSLGDKIELTSKGLKTVRVMILGDDRSSYENNDVQITYSQALAEVKSRSLKTSNKKHENSWWKQVLG